jgi:hypothetical protein
LKPDHLDIQESVFPKVPFFFFADSFPPFFVKSLVFGVKPAPFTFCTSNIAAGSSQRSLLLLCADQKKEAKALSSRPNTMSSWRNSSPLHQTPQQQQQQLFSPAMMSPQQYPSSNTTAAAAATASSLENGPRAKCDQVVFEAIAKAAEIVVGSRCWIDHIPSAAMGGGGALNSSNSRRFNLLVPEVQGVR